MMRHPSEDKLIKYQFRLLDETGQQKITEHLEGCEKCRGRLAQIAEKFSALDLLKDEINVSEELIADTVSYAKGPKRLAFRRPVWIGTAAAIAAVLLVGALVIMPNLNKVRQTKYEVARKIPAEDMDLAEEAESIRPRAFASADKTSKPVAMAKTDSRETNMLAGVGYNDEFVPDKPPFAPASNIELVTLPKRDNVQLTIYNSADLTLVREKRKLTMKKGWNWLQFMWANTLIDPTSLSLEPSQHRNKINIEQLVFPPRLRELGRWLIKSQVTGEVPFEITYFTSGLNWRAFYMGTLSSDEKKMKLAGYVRVSNKSGEDYENAQARLIVGKVHQIDRIVELARRKYAHGSPIKIIEEDSDISNNLRWNYKGDIPQLGDTPIVGGVFYANGFAYKPKEIKKEGLSEYFLYTIEGTETIANQWAKRLPSFEIENIDVNGLYKYDEEKWGKDTIRFVSFANDAEHNMGETPLPNGNVKIYRKLEGDGLLGFVGGANVKYIPVDEEVELNLGVARKVTVESKLMEKYSENYEFDPNGNISGWDDVEKWQIEINNTRSLPVDIEIMRKFYSRYTSHWKLNTDEAGYEKYDLTHGKFELNVEPSSKKTIEYTTTYYQKARQESRLRELKGK